MRIAIIGSGVSGLVTAHLLHGHHDVVLYESEERPGGHSHTHRIELPDLTCDVDTGFLVYNERTYPLFCRLLDELGVATKPSDMSFSVADQRTGLEWRGTSPSTVFAQRRNLVRPDFLRMLADVARFNRLARGLLADPPLTASRWRTCWPRIGGRPDSVTGTSCRWAPPSGRPAPSTFTQIPAGTFARFFERHGLLSLRDQPQWRTVDGGSKRYVDAIVRPLRNEGRLRLGSPVEKIRREPGGVEVVSRNGIESYDHVVLATHSDQALRLLSDPDRMERETLGALRYLPNRATLHTDASLMPTEHRAWASWNYHRLEAERDEATLTYYLNRLQGFDSATPVLVTLNRDDAIDPEKVLARMDYAHPVIDPAAVRAQGRPARDQRHPAHLVRRCILGLRLSRGWRAQCGGDVSGPGGDLVTAVVTTPRWPPGAGAGHRRRPGRRGPTGTPTASAVPSTRAGCRTRVRPGAEALIQLTGWPCRCSIWLRSMPSWACTRPGRAAGSAPVTFRREDFLGDPATPLTRAVQDLVSDRTGRRPEGPVAMLANLRTWGWLFNPISLYFCADPGHRSVARGRSAPWWPRSRTRPGTTVTPMWWAPRAPTDSPRSSMYRRFSPLTSTTGSATPLRGRDSRSPSTCSRPTGAFSLPPCRCAAARWIVPHSAVSCGATPP